MDSLIKRFDARKDSDLMLCEHRGVAYQRDMRAGRVLYDVNYLAKIESYDAKVAKAVNAARCAFVAKHASGSKVLDIGAGDGAFVRAAVASGIDVKGFDVIPTAAENLRQAGLFAENAHEFGAITLWDTIEHIEDPHPLLRNIRKEALVFVSVPVFEDLKKIRASKHYRPGEHLYYWSYDGFVEWMSLYGFRLLERSSHETEAGRDSIGAFVFRKDLPDYNDHIGAYDQIHSMRHYGGSSTELHLKAIAAIVKKRQPQSIIDYGCGRSDLVAHFWKDGERKIARYDPAIPKFKDMPPGPFDLVLCCDVMEHIPMSSVDVILQEIRRKSYAVVFTISTKLARTKLPDGRNAHVTLLTKSEWVGWIKDVFGKAEIIKTEWDHMLMVSTF